MARYVYILRTLDADEHFYVGMTGGCFRSAGCPQCGARAAYGEVQTLGLEDVHLV